MSPSPNRSFDIESLVRPNIRRLQPYRSARDDFETGLLLDANENSLGAPFRDAEGLNRYPSPQQYELRKRIADFRDVDVDNVFVGVGSDEAIDLLLRIFCEPARDRIIITPPTYGMYKVAAQINDITVDEVLLSEDFQLRPDRILAAVRPETRLLFLCSPNNPTGNHLKLFEIEKLLDRFPGLVVVDEAYIDFSSRKSLAARVREYPNLVVLQTMSKAFGLAGIRLGMAIASPDIIGYMMKVKAPYNLNTLTSKYAREAFDHLGQIRWNIDEIIQERNRLAHELNAFPGIDQVAPSDANFLLFKVDGAYDIYRRLAEEGVIIRYRGHEPHCENGLRVTIGTPEENNRFLEKLTELLA